MTAPLSLLLLVLLFAQAPWTSAVGRFRQQDVEYWKGLGVAAVQRHPKSAQAVTSLPLFSTAKRNASGGIWLGSIAYQNWAEQRGYAPLMALRTEADSEPSDGCLSVDLPPLDPAAEKIVYDFTRDSGNIFDGLTDTRTMCCIRLAQEHPNATFVMVMGHQPRADAPSFLEYVLPRICGFAKVEFADASALNGAAIAHNFGGRLMAQPHSFELNLKYAAVAQLRTIRQRMHDSLPPRTLQDHSPHALLVVRNVRALVDSVTGTVAELIAVMASRLPL